MNRIEMLKKAVKEIKYQYEITKINIKYGKQTEEQLQLVLNEYFDIKAELQECENYEYLAQQEIAY